MEYFIITGNAIKDDIILQVKELPAQFEIIGNTIAKLTVDKPYYFVLLHNNQYSAWHAFIEKDDRHRIIGYMTNYIHEQITHDIDHAAHELWRTVFSLQQKYDNPELIAYLIKDRHELIVEMKKEFKVTRQILDTIKEASQWKYDLFGAYTSYLHAIDWEGKV